MTDVSFSLAFIAGVLSFLSPCVLPLVPSYVSFITGVSFEKLTSGEDRQRVRLLTITNSVLFVLGFSTVFIALGASASYAGHLLFQYQDWIRIIGGVMVIIFGLFIAGFLKLDFLMKERKFRLQGRPAGYIGSFVIGMAFAAGWTPCIGPMLGSILLYSELLMTGDVPKNVRKDLGVIHNEAKRASTIMTNLLTYGRKVEPKVHRVDLHKILKKVSSMRQYREKVQNIKLINNLLEGPLYVNGDHNQFMQVFMNLVLNAEEALSKSSGGNIIVTTKIDRKRIKVSIADDGTGIPEENLSQIFHPFFTTKQVGEGTGLGLSTCYGIVTGHNGLIRAENNEMGGATFTVELPLAKASKK